MALNYVQEDTRSSASFNKVHWDHESHTIVICNRVIALTATEYRLLFPLRHEGPVSYSKLALMVYKCDLDRKVRLMMDKHIDRIRSKLRGTGIYVYCMLGYGYILLPEIHTGDV